MNQDPYQSSQPVAPVTETAVIEQTTVVVAEPRKGLAITGFVLSLVSLVIAVIFPVSIPLAITGLIISIIVLAKHKAGRGLAIAGVVIAPVTLVVLLFLALITLASYQGITERANQAQQKAEQSKLNQSTQTN